jgi:hypothetical protein
MRKLGYTLLILGVVILVVREMHFVQWGIDLAYRHAQGLPQKQNYTKREVDDAMRQAAVSMAERAGGAVPFALVIVLGGILLDFASKRRTRRAENAGQGAPSDGGPATLTGSSKAAEGPPSMSDR